MPAPLKPRALRPGDGVRLIAPASPMEADRLNRGAAELERLGYRVRRDARVLARDGYFAGSTAERLRELLDAIREPDTRAIICARGGYGSNYLLDELLGEVYDLRETSPPKILVGYSDISSLQVFLWEKCGWVTFYGPMAAAGFDGGAGGVTGYDLASLSNAISRFDAGWAIELEGEAVVSGKAEGRVLGGCLTLLISTLGTPWALDTRGAILALEDRAMKPWQIDRALMHLKQAGKLDGLAGLLFGDFPGCEGPEGSATVRDVVARITGSFGIPVVFGVPFGHTERPMLTLPLGVRAKLIAGGPPRLEFLEAVCTA